MSTNTQQLSEIGVSIWLDDLSRERIASGGLQKLIAERVLKEINARLRFLVDVGLDYLSLDRASGTLSGGEAQRIRLASQIGSGLTGVLYVLDEPSIGLHQRDNHRLIETLTRLKRLGNTLIVVEHDEDTIRTADWVVDIGPGAGEHGGRVVHSGTFDELLTAEESVTGAYLAGRRSIPTPEIRRGAAPTVIASSRRSWGCSPRSPSSGSASARSPSVPPCGSCSPRLCRHPPRSWQHSSTPPHQPSGAAPNTDQD